MLVAAGVLGFFYEASFATGDDAKADEVLGILAVNGWHNLVHIATGVLGLVVAGSYASARALRARARRRLHRARDHRAADGQPGPLLDIVPVNDEDNVLHLLIGVAGIGAGLATPATPAPSTGGPAA